jgi:hypothetical protein
MKRAWLGVFIAFFLQVLPGFSRGDKVIPQVADGSNIRTKFDLTNISPSVTIGNFKLKFYKQNGQVWTVKTNLGTASEYTLNIAPRQTLRIETQGATSPAAAGYAVIEDNEPQNSVYSMDYVLGISVYYEISNAKGVVDTISVPVAQPTALGTLPVEYTQAKGVYTGIAVVNLMNGANSLKIDLYASGTGTSSSTTINLAAGQQRAEFFHESLFPALRTQDFKGLAEFKADGPVAILALLQTNSYTGDVQYATLVPTDREGLRRNSYMYVPEATYVGSANNTMPVDIDNFIVDFFRVGDDEGFSWDLVYEATGKTTRQLKPVNGAGVYPLGVMEDTAIDALSLPQLMALTYTTTPIDLSDNKPALQIKYAFAVLTELGNYAKVRLIGTKTFNDTAGNPFVDLMFEVTVYR